jgi:hypothetical protein
MRNDIGPRQLSVQRAESRKPAGLKVIEEGTAAAPRAPHRGVRARASQRGGVELELWAERGRR